MVEYMTRRKRPVWSFWQRSRCLKTHREGDSVNARPPLKGVFFPVTDVWKHGHGGVVMWRMLLLTSILFIACTPSSADLPTATPTPTPLPLTEGEAIATIQEFLGELTYPGGEGQFSCRTIIQNQTEVWDAEMLEDGAWVIRALGDLETTSLSRLRGTGPARDQQGVWRLYPSGLIQTVEGKC